MSETAVPLIHRLEQVSSEEKIGSLAENLMEALKEHPEAKTKVRKYIFLDKGAKISVKTNQGLTAFLCINVLCALP